MLDQKVEGQGNVTYGDLVNLIEQYILNVEGHRCANIAYKYRWVYTWQIRTVLVTDHGLDPTYEQIREWFGKLAQEGYLQTIKPEGLSSAFSVTKWEGAEPFELRSRYLVFKNR